MEEEEASTKRILSLQEITITSVTWNLYGDLPPINSLVHLAKSQYFCHKPHLIFFGTQECERALWVTLCCEAKQKWEAMLQQVFTQYDLKVIQVMRGLHSAVLIHKKVSIDAQIYRVDKLKSGACGLMGTKGAISILLLLKGALIQLINCHLAANQEQTQARNNTIAQIMDNMIDKSHKADVIFLGDFNYRIEMSKKQYQMMLMNKVNNTEANMNYKSMLKKEQLFRQSQLKQQFLLKFQEGSINFPPTYKLALYEDQYNRDRIPGWTDRIFHRLSPTLIRTSYGSLFSVKGCDHRPVVATYIKKLTGNAFKHTKNDASSCQLI